MTKVTRKNLLQKTSAGALMVGTLGIMPGVAAAAARPDAVNKETHLAELESAEPFVVYVRNPKAGDLVLMVGNHEIAYHDPALVARLWHARHSTARRSATSAGR